MVSYADSGIHVVCEHIGRVFGLDKKVEPDIPLREQIPEFSPKSLCSIFRSYGIGIIQLSPEGTLRGYVDLMARYAILKEKTLGFDEPNINIRCVLRQVNPRHIFRTIEFLDISSQGD
jgi:hypothetical protein